MLTYSKGPVAPVLLAAIEQIESPAPRARDAAIKTMQALLNGMTLAEFVEKILDIAHDARPPWQLTAKTLLSSFYEQLSPLGREFCERLSQQSEPPIAEDAETLRELHQVFWGE